MLATGTVPANMVTAASNSSDVISAVTASDTSTTASKATDNDVSTAMSKSGITTRTAQTPEAAPMVIPPKAAALLREV